jgi:hypothetical protein
MAAVNAQLGAQPATLQPLLAPAEWAALKRICG